VIYLGIKRVLDLVAALFLLAMLSPLLLIIGLVIRLQDGGPAIFRQSRTGRDGKLFQFYKFRSMTTDTPNVESKAVGVQKITPFGKFIRRTNLDELPQFYNVLKGDMSLIGPRPPIPSQVKIIEMRRANGALKLRPGLTGWAQVNAFDGMSDAVKANFDGYYADNVSLWLDVWIVLRTLVYFTKKPPTY
jgi:O-antigen biosynthesis protein WbqP